MSKIVAMLQSNYIPWKGYFDIINSVDEFIIYDHVQYTKNDWRNRNKIKTSNGPMWLTIPVRQNKLSQTIDETTICDHFWRRKHLNAILFNYSKAKYFEQYFTSFEKFYLENKDEFLSDINYKLILLINEILGIKTKISKDKDYEVKGDKVDKLINLCKQTDSNIYLSGPSGKNYIDEKLFSKENINVIWMNYSNYPEYTQLYPPFVHEVSVIDLIFNEGPNAMKYMKSFSAEYL